jgi:hypothetical protein
MPGVRMWMKPLLRYSPYADISTAPDALDQLKKGLKGLFGRKKKAAPPTEATPEAAAPLPPTTTEAPAGTETTPPAPAPATAPAADTSCRSYRLLCRHKSESLLTMRLATATEPPAPAPAPETNAAPEAPAATTEVNETAPPAPAAAPGEIAYI